MRRSSVLTPLRLRKVQNEMFPKARTRSPLIIKLDASQKKLFMREMFGPISYIIATDNTAHSMALAKEAARELGAITWGAYSSDQSILDAIQDAAEEVGVALSCNLTGQIFVNQSAAFSDFHVTGCNAAGNATLTDAAFVAPRFRVVETRTVAPATEAAQTEIKPATAAATP
jgi:acyl-CoA reductase-like NAD-dependent aldehyde dehydrogenase